MVELCLMASHGYLPGSELVFHQEHHRVLKDCQHYLPNMVAGQEIARPISFRLKPHQSVTGIELANRFPRMDSMTTREPALINVKDEWQKKILLGKGIAEQYTRHDKIMQFLESRRSEFEAGEVDLSEVSELMGLQSLQPSVNLEACTPHINTNRNFEFANPLVDFLGDMARNSKITVHPDGRVLLSGTETEIKDIIPLVAEFYLTNSSSTSSRKQSTLIPQFNWLNAYESDRSSLKASVAPVNSHQKVKVKPSLKRKTSKRGNSRERDLYKNNYFHACETLLSIMMNKRLNGKTAILSMKKSAPELHELLTQFSAGVAGTGIAVLFSVACKVACSGRVPLCTSKLLGTGLGFGLVWLSWAVNQLGETIVRVSRNSSKGLKDEEVVRCVNRSLKDVYLRAATLLAVAVLRVA